MNRPSLACEHLDVVDQTSVRSDRLTSINWLLGLLRLDAGVVRISGLGFEASRRAVSVQVATTVHGLLERVAFPTEDVVAVGSSATVRYG